MNQTNINTHVNDSESSVSAVGKNGRGHHDRGHHDEEEEEHDDEAATQVKRARIIAQEKENTHYMNIYSRTPFPLSEVLTNYMSVKDINAAPVGVSGESHHENNTNAGETIQFNPIEYKDEKWTLPPLRKVKSTEHALKHLETKLQYNENHAKSRDQTEKKRLYNIHAILKRFLLANFSKVQCSIKLKSIIQNDEGVYIGYYSPDRPPKFGFCRNFRNRIKYQPDIQVAAKVLLPPTLNQVDEIVQEIIDQSCPWLSYHPDNVGLKRKIIMYHLQELLIACCFETSTMLIGELFMTLPSDTVLALLSLDKTEAANLKSVVSLIESQQYTGIFEIYTWPTLSSHLLSLAKNEPNGFLSAKLRDERELQFVTNYFNQVCLSPNISHDWVDAVDCCPRVVQLFSLISDLKKLLIVDGGEPSAIVSTIHKWIQQDNGDSDFVRPITSELACGAKQKIKTFLSSESAGSQMMLKLENVTFDALCTHEKEFMEDEFDLESEMKVCADNPLTFLFTKKKPKETSCLHLSQSPVATILIRHRGRVWR